MFIFSLRNETVGLTLRSLIEPFYQAYPYFGDVC
jgi:hypothetical protein